MKSERKNPAMLTAILFGLDWSDESDVSINSVVGHKDQAWCGRALLAFVKSGEVDTVLLKTLCNEYLLDGICFEGANGSRIKNHGQRRFRVKTACWKQLRQSSA